MARDIERHALLTDAFEVDPGEDDHFGTEGGASHIMSVRADHATPSVEDEFIVIAGEAARDFEIARQIAAAHYASRRDHEASAFESVMPAGDLVHLFDRGPERDVNVLAGIVQRLPRERHPVLPTNQSADATGRGFDHAQAVAKIGRASCRERG